MQYIKKTYNGVQVIFAPMADSTSITIEIVVKAGSLYETKETNWLSHFLEHMFFKWWKKYTSPKVVVETIDQIGWEFNAYTGNEYAWYYVKSAPEHINIAIDVLSDMMVHSTFPPEEVEKEKWVVIQEIKMYEDRPDAKVINIRNRNYFGDNSFGWEIIWPESNVLGFTQDDLFNHQKQLYTKDNMLIVIAWKVNDMEAIGSMIGDLFAQLPETYTGTLPSYTWNHPRDKRDIVSNGTHQNHIVFGGPWFAHDAPQYYAAKLLANIVWGTMSSRLFQEIREKRWLCYYIGCGHQSAPTHWTFVIRAGLSKENYDEWITAIKKELEMIADTWITEDELQKARWNILGKLQMWIETSDQMADFIGSQQLLYWKILSLEDILAEYQKVTLWDIQAIKNMLHPSNFYGCTID